MSNFSSLLRRAALVVPLLIFAGLLAPRAARASHALGADMSYTNVGPGLYYVQYRFYRDCGGLASAPAAAPLVYEATGCGALGTGTVAALTQNLALRDYNVGNPYCRVINATSPCDSAGGGVVSFYSNYQAYSYAGIVNLGTAPDQQCAQWRLSVSINARPGVANLVNADVTNLYTHALLNNSAGVTDGGSPVFSVAGGLQPLMFMCDSTSIRYNSAVTDPDGDSLVYSLQQPLSGATTVVPYTAGYTAQQPVRTLAGAPPLTLDANGTLTFTAGANNPNLGSNNENNKYIVVIQVDAYRRVNGQVIQTGQVRRELAAAIVPCADAPTGPFIPAGGITVMAGSQPAYSPAPGAVIPAYPNVPLTITVQIADARGTDSLWVRLKANPFGSAATFAAPAAIGATTATFTWTPTAADVRSQPYVVYFDGVDNECPVAQRACFALPIQVVTGRPAGLTSAVGGRQLLRAAPNPFSTNTRLTVTTAAADPTTAVRIYDLTGRLLDQLRVPAGAGTHELTWHAPATLPAGVYVARFAGGANQQTVRLVKE